MRSPSMSRGPTLTSAPTRCKAASQSSRRNSSRRLLKPCKGAQTNVLEFPFSQTCPASVLPGRTPLHRTGYERYSPSFLQRVAMKLDDGASFEDESVLGRPQREDRRRC